MKAATPLLCLLLLLALPARVSSMRYQSVRYAEKVEEGPSKDRCSDVTGSSAYISGLRKKAERQIMEVTGGLGNAVPTASDLKRFDEEVRVLE